ncbi:nuclear transport factor 2 family protein [Streptomyces sp. NPDC093970]|uniref:nuclear transport factor 2 family protein n=1 Tax=Streptomyces sp. NPDC093970 TaxID=3155076 RepID=UPI003438C1CA
MRRTDTEIVHAAYEAIRNGDVTAAAALLHPEVTIRQSDRLPWGGVHHGLAGFREFFAVVGSHISSTVEPEAVYLAGDRVVQVGRTRGTVRGNGRSFDSREVHVWRITDGLVAALEIYVEDEKFLAAFGE